MGATAGWHDPVAAGVHGALQLPPVPWSAADRQIRRSNSPAQRVRSLFASLQQSWRSAAIDAVDGAWLLWVTRNAVHPLLEATDEQEIERVLRDVTPAMLRQTIVLTYVRTRLGSPPAAQQAGARTLADLETLAAERLGDDAAHAVRALDRGWRRARGACDRLGAEAMTVDVTVPVMRWLWAFLGLTAAATGADCTPVARAWLVRTGDAMAEELYAPYRIREIELKFTRSEAEVGADDAERARLSPGDAELLREGEAFEAELLSGLSARAG